MAYTDCPGSWLLNGILSTTLSFRSRELDLTIASRYSCVHGNGFKSLVFFLGILDVGNGHQGRGTGIGTYPKKINKWSTHMRRHV